MTLPGFDAEASLHASHNTYRSVASVQPGDGDVLGGGQSATVIPAIPYCGNCDYILDRCALNGWRPRALCRACLVGDCYSGVERPPQQDPFGVPFPRPPLGF